MFDLYIVFFFFNHTAPPEIYTLSLHDALPIFRASPSSTNNGVDVHRKRGVGAWMVAIGTSSPFPARGVSPSRDIRIDRKSTRLNSSHANISYAVFCLKKKNQPRIITTTEPSTV